MCDLENISQVLQRSDTYKVTGVIVKEVSVSLH